jgi:hypothetical protein
MLLSDIIKATERIVKYVELGLAKRVQPNIRLSGQET